MKHIVKILMLGGAKRVSMARHFLVAAERLNITLQLYSYELDSCVPIATVAEIIKGKRWSDSGIMFHLHSVVEHYGIDIMIPFVDGAVGIVARYMLEYNDIWAPVGSISSAEIMFDKVTASRVFEENGIDIPRTYIKGAPRFPLIAKPRYGSASKGIMILRNSTDFRKLRNETGEFLVQEYVEHGKEYTVDCYVTHNGDIICTVPRRRLEVTGGEVSRTVTVKSRLIETTARMILKRLALTGAVTIQFIEDEASGRLLLMEINPRLGGGAVCSVAAGAPIPQFILEEFMGKTLIPCESWRDATEIARYFSEVIFHHDEE